MDKLSLHIESLIFAAEQAISFEEIKASLEDTFETPFEEEIIESSINELIEKFHGDHFSIEIVEISGGFTFMTKGAYHLTISNYLKQITKKKLSKAAMETLAIIAYKQPVSKTEIESIRGVNCDYSIQKLLEKELIEIAGRSEGVGKPLLYATSQKFFDYFGLKNITDLPKINDLEIPENEIGEPSAIEYVSSITKAINETSDQQMEFEFDDKEVNKEGIIDGDSEE